MDSLPPAGSFRRRAALAFFLLGTAVLAYLLLHSVIDWIAERKPFPILEALGAIGGAVVCWQWIIQELRKRAVDQRQSSGRAA